MRKSFSTRVILSEPIKDKNFLEIKVYYGEQGENYFDGSMVRNSIRVSLTPMRVKDGMCCFSISRDRHESGFFYEAVEVSRYNAKKLEKFYNALLPHTQEITTLYEKRDYNGVMKIIHDVAENFS